MDLQLAGQVAVVVGGARGLGSAIAAAFHEEGAAVAVVDRDPSVERVVEILGPEGRERVLAIVADATDLAAVRDVERQTRARLGGCDHVVYAAGVGSGQFGMPYWHVDPALWERVLQVNLVGAVNVAHAFGPGMAAAGSGTLLFIASVAGQIGSPTDPPYSASKAGLINFAQCCARDLAAYGVRVNALCPGMVKTELNRAVYESWAARQPDGERGDYDTWAAEKIQRLVPLNRWQEPADIAAMAVVLASPRSRSITGQTINVDGGYVMHS